MIITLNHHLLPSFLQNPASMNVARAKVFVLEMLHIQPVLSNLNLNIFGLQRQ